MPDVWLPGAYRDPGVNAGYRNGRCRLERPLAHATVGSDSRGVGKRGYFNLLVHRDESRENGCTQYAEIDAVTWHSFEPHRLFGFGVEFERLTTGGMNDEGLSNFEDLTQNQIVWGRRIVDFAHEHGVPANLYDGPRYQVDGYHGWVNHKDVDPSRSDGLTRAEWSLVSSTTPSPEQDGGLMWAVYYQNIDGSVTFIHGIGTVVAFRLIGQPVAPYGLPMKELDYIGWSFGGVTTKLVNPATGDKLEKASKNLLAL